MFCQNGFSCLIIASQSRSAEITELLCRQRVDLNQQENTTGQSAIWVASLNGSMDVVKVLIHLVLPSALKNGKIIY